MGLIVLYSKTTIIQVSFTRHITSEDESDGLDLCSLWVWKERDRDGTRESFASRVAPKEIKEWGRGREKFNEKFEKVKMERDFSHSSETEQENQEDCRWNYVQIVSLIVLHFLSSSFSKSLFSLKKALHQFLLDLLFLSTTHSFRGYKLVSQLFFVFSIECFRMENGIHTFR